MSIYTKILLTNLENRKSWILFPKLKKESDKVVHSACRQAIQEIAEVVSDAAPNEEDADYFVLVQRVLVALSKIGVDLNWNEFK